MKIICLTGFPDRETKKKWGRIMRITLFLMVGFLLTASANSYSQNTRLNIKLKDGTVTELMKFVEDNSEFVFLYKNEDLDLEKKVNVELENATIQQVLDAGFKGQNVGWDVYERQIIIHRALAKRMPAENIQQQRTVTGVVTDQSGLPLPGVTVVVAGTTTGTVTNADGNFSLAIPDNAETLQFSFVGMRTQEIPIDGRTTFTVVMEEETIGIEEVVAVGYGTQKKVSVTGSISTIDSDFLESRPLTNSSQALQGVQGVYVNQVGGQPGADNATIRIRGIGTLNNNDPLVLVDGIEYSIRDVNPADIESVSVLKDAASASIYGTRAANGVILITTKKGKKGEIKMELNSYYGWQEATYLPDQVSDALTFMIGRNQASINEGQPPPYSDSEVEEYRNGTDPDIFPNTDWWDLMFSVAPMHNHHLRLSGGSEHAIYSLSLGYMDQDGVLMGTEAKNYSISSNFIYMPIDNLELGANIKGTFWDRNEPYETKGSGVNSLMAIIPRSLPINQNILSDGRYGQTHLRTPAQNIFKHPVARAKESFENFKTQRAQIILTASYLFPFDIKYEINFGINKYDQNQHSFMPELYLYNPKEPDVPRQNETVRRNVSRMNISNLNTTFFQTLNWNKTFNKHNFNLLSGFSMESFSNSFFSSYIEGFIGNELTELNAGNANKDVSGTSTESKLMSYFGRAGYNYSEKYLFEFNFRYDGSSRFAQGNRWGFFPSFSAGWRISEEQFFESIETISNLKIRASWGQLGNQNIGLYRYLNVINLNQGYSFNNQIVPGSAVTTLSDSEITWEKTTISNAGLDIGLWNNRIELGIDLFSKTTKDILATVNVPAQVGDLNGPTTNLYGMTNKGIEASAQHKNVKGEFKYGFGGHITIIHNNVDYLSGDVKFINNNFGNLRVIKEGFPVESWYGFEALGIFQSEQEVKNHAFQHNLTGPGDIKYKDLNNDGVIDSEDQKIIGSSIPKYTYGFNLDADFKGFDFSAFFQGVQNIQFLPYGKIAFPYFNGGNVTYDQLENAWTPENPNAKYPRLSLYWRGSQINSKNSTFWLRDISYLRLKNIQLGYTLPFELTRSVNIDKVRFYANAQNFLTLSKYKETDPEVTVNISGDYYDYPSTKIFTIGCNITF